MIRAAGRCAAALPAAVLAYLLLAGALGVLGVNRDFRPTAAAQGGVLIYVRSNGFHAEIVLPTKVDGIDWSTAFPATHMRSLAAPTRWLAFGWGDRAFMLETPTWRDIRFGTSFRALAGLGDGAMHVEYVARPEDYAVTPLRVSREQHARLAALVDASFRRTPAGAPIRIDAPGYFDTDAFYEAVPTYTFWFTCNEWVRALLSEAGLPAPLWAPFERPLFWHLPKTEAAYSFGGTYPAG